MAVISPEILMAGNSTRSVESLILRVGAHGNQARHVGTLGEARSLMETVRFAVIIAAETLPDGRGYDLAVDVMRQRGYLYVGVRLSETLWLPVVERGSFVLGERALNVNAFENEFVMALGAARGDANAEIRRKPGAAATTSHSIATPKRRRDAAA
jgi:hypothetical protein